MPSRNGNAYLLRCAVIRAAVEHIDPQGIVHEIFIAEPYYAGVLGIRFKNKAYNTVAILPSRGQKVNIKWRL